MEQVTNNYYYTTGRPGAARRPQPKPIDWSGWFSKLKANRRQFYYSLPAAFVVACVVMISIPDYYDVNVKLAPELGGRGGSSSGLGSLMSSFGLGGGASGGGDAVTPSLYPDLMNSKTFLVSMFNVPVQSQDTTIRATYFEYLSEHQKSPWWSSAISSVRKAISSLFADVEVVAERPIDPSNLTPKQDAIATAIGSKIMCSVDKKTNIITINVTDQDPVICATIADSACHRLQDFITDYRTKKARQELENIQAQLDKTRMEYEAAKEVLANFNRSNWAIVSEEVRLQQQFLQNDMQLKYSAYSAFNSQLVAARTKLEESRPVYTVLDGASVPLRKSGPKRGATVIFFTFFVLFLHVVYILRKELADHFTAPAPAPSASSDPTTVTK